MKHHKKLQGSWECVAIEDLRYLFCAGSERKGWLGAHTAMSEDDAREWGMYHYGPWARPPDKVTLTSAYLLLLYIGKTVYTHSISKIVIAHIKSCMIRCALTNHFGGARLCIEVLAVWYVGSF